MGAIGKIIDHYRMKINEKWCKYANGEISKEEYECFVLKMENERDNEILELAKGLFPKPTGFGIDDYTDIYPRIMQNLSNLTKETT